MMVVANQPGLDYNILNKIDTATISKDLVANWDEVNRTLLE